MRSQWSCCWEECCASFHAFGLKVTTGTEADSENEHLMYPRVIPPRGQTQSSEHVGGASTIFQLSINQIIGVIAWWRTVKLEMIELRALSRTYYSLWRSEAGVRGQGKTNESGDNGSDWTQVQTSITSVSSAGCTILSTHDFHVLLMFSSFCAVNMLLSCWSFPDRAGLFLPFQNESWQTPICSHLVCPSASSHAAENTLHTYLGTFWK